MDIRGTRSYSFRKVVKSNPGGVWQYLPYYTPKPRFMNAETAQINMWACIMRIGFLDPIVFYVYRDSQGLL